MPRLTAKQYLKDHDRLRKVWLRDSRVFAELPVQQQRQLHEFFVPAADLSDLQLLMHREAVTEKNPSLRHQAGRALSRLHRALAEFEAKQAFRAAHPAIATVRRKEDREFQIKPLARPEVDARKLARAFMYVVRARADHAGGHPPSAGPSARSRRHS